MKKSLIVASLVIAVVASTGNALAQIIPPGGSQFNPPLPQPLPGPKIEVPVVPKMDELPSRNYLPAQRPSFSDRITTCLEEGAAGGLGPGDREAYSRSCANSR
jgi:Rieske Fe-S protein